jgi:uncharacterized flavoprotein (TIGR03862 family)
MSSGRFRFQTPLGHTPLSTIPTPPVPVDPASDTAFVLQADVAVVGGGPAGLMAAEVLSAAGFGVHVFDAMPTVGRKFLLAGLGGLNLTHAEPFEAFVSRFAERAPQCRAWLQEMGPQDVRDWAAGLGIETFVGSSQRVFPTDMKAAPLLRSWLHRLRHPQGGSPVGLHMRHRWDGGCAALPGNEGWGLSFVSPQGLVEVRTRAVVLALGGGSWARLGSDGAWVPWLRATGADVRELRPANCGFDVRVGGRLGWSEHLAQRHAGAAFKNVAIEFTDALGRSLRRKGEFVLTRGGIEGSLVYAFSAQWRDEIERRGCAVLTLDLRPDLSQERVRAELERPRAGKTLSSVLKGRLALGAAASGLLHECLAREVLGDPHRLAQAIKALPIELAAPRPLDEAISSAGGVALEALTPGLMLAGRPGWFCAGEMLDWEAPTGGYLLTACLASGRVAGGSACDWLRRSPAPLARSV